MGNNPLEAAYSRASISGSISHGGAVARMNAHLPP
jgi:hypothetical protein